MHAFMAQDGPLSFQSASWKECCTTAHQMVKDGILGKAPAALLDDVKVVASPLFGHQIENGLSMSRFFVAIDLYVCEVAKLGPAHTAAFGRGQFRQFVTRLVCDHQAMPLRIPSSMMTCLAPGPAFAPRSEPSGLG